MEDEEREDRKNVICGNSGKRCRGPPKSSSSFFLPLLSSFSVSSFSLLLLSCSFLFFFVLSCAFLFFLVLSCSFWFFLVLSCSVLFFLVLSCSFWFFPLLSCSFFFFVLFFVFPFLSYCREAALKSDIGTKTHSATRPGPAHPPATWPRNCPFKGVRLRDSWVLRDCAMKGFPQLADRPNGLAVSGTTSKLRGRGFKSRYDRIENPLRQNETCVLGRLPRTILEQNLLRGPNGLHSPMY